MELQISMRRRTPPQRRISSSMKRFNIASWGRQSGKTTHGLDKMIVRPITGRKGGIYWYVLQTHSAAEIAFNRYWKLFESSPELLKKKPNESGKFVTLYNDATIFFKSGANFEDLRMETLDGAIIDEYRQQDPNLWPMIIRPMLARRKGWADILSTPNGFDHFQELFEAAKADPEWGWFHAPSTEAWWWTESEIKSHKSTLTPDQYDQEVLAEFREIGIGKAYLRHGSWNFSETNPLAPPGRQWNPYLPIIVGLDFNVGIMAWELGQMRNNEWYYGDEVALTHTNTDMQTPFLIEKLKGHPAGALLIGDASGKANKSSASGQTDYSIICKGLTEAGIKFQNLTPESNPHVKDRINAFNSRLKSADEQIHLWYSPTRCPRLKRDLERVKWKQGATGAMLDKSDIDLTHASDAASYPVVFYAEEFKPKPGVVRIIQR